MIEFKDKLNNDARRQLFVIVREARLTEFPTFDNDTGLYDLPATEVKPAIVMMHWPNGHPCTEADLYLLSLVQNGARLNANGGSVREEAGKLSHLVRFCYARGVNFWELDSARFKQFLTELENEKRSDGKKYREPNRVIEISDSCIRFLMWMQKDLLPHRSIANVNGKPYQVLLRLKKTRDPRGRTYTSLHFSHNPARSTRQLKLPMPKESIDALFEAVRKRYDVKNCNPKFAARFPNETALRTYLDFKAATWDCILSVCLAFGCRPAEVTGMPLTVNMEALDKEKRLVLATMKREKDASRRVPVTMATVIKLKVYDGTHRTKMLEHLRATGKTPAPNDIVFLNSYGNPLTKETLTRQFERLCRYAGLNARTCLSMFRHRAITSLVAIHLKEFCVGRLDVAMQALTDADYSTILAKVAAITGHRDPESLRPYIHLAWDELGAFDTVNAAIALNAMLLTIRQDFASNMATFERAPAKEQKDAAQRFLHWIREVSKEMDENLEAFRYVNTEGHTLVP